MVALLDDTVLHHQDEIRVPDGRQAVRDDGLVRPRIRLSMAFWMRTSVRVSTELVALVQNQDFRIG